MIAYYADQADAAMALGLSATATIPEALGAFVTSRRVVRGVTPATARKYCKDLEWWSVRLGGKPVDRIRPVEIEAVTAAALEEGLGRSTVAGRVRRLKTFLTWIQRRPEFVTPGTVLPGVVVEVPKVKPRPRPVLSAGELLEVFARFSRRAPHLADMLRALFLMGVRPAAIADLKWRDVKRPRPRIGSPGRVILPAMKGGEIPVRYFERGSILDEILEAARVRFRRFHGFAPRGRHPVFPSRRGKGHGFTAKGFSAEVSRIAREVGAAGFTAYVVRHSAVTILKARGVSSSAIRHYATHKSDQTQSVYDHTTAINASPALEVVEGILGGVCVS